ncbi:MAG: GNAT family N-acetyltransferase [Turicibacter sp.]|nr:GNAT family N-acetyltransferase [Turicibacter sp.]
MEKLLIRDLDVMDVPVIKRIIKEVWDFSSLVKNEAILDAVVGLYLNQMLAGSTFGKVAVLDGEVLGMVSGIVKGEALRYAHLLEDGMGHAMTLLLAKRRQQKWIYEYFSKQEAVYAQLLDGVADEYDASLDFLILSKAAQGKGVGKALWLVLQAYFVEQQVSRAYLFTDTDCNFGFYEHQGFKRRREAEAVYRFSGFKMRMTNFLYEMEMGG